MLKRDTSVTEKDPGDNFVAGHMAGAVLNETLQH